MEYAGFEYDYGNCERFCFCCHLSAFVSKFQQSRIRALRKFFGKKVILKKEETC